MTHPGTCCYQTQQVALEEGSMEQWSKGDRILQGLPSRLGWPVSPQTTCLSLPPHAGITGACGHSWLIFPLMCVVLVCEFAREGARLYGGISLSHSLPCSMRQSILAEASILAKASRLPLDIPASSFWVLGSQACTTLYTLCFYWYITNVQLSGAWVMLWYVLVFCSCQ